MKVILTQDIKGVGKKDEIINASDGYARNFLFPKKLAVEANNENMSKLKAKKQSEQYKKDVNKENAEKIYNAGCAVAYDGSSPDRKVAQRQCVAYLLAHRQGTAHIRNVVQGQDCV